LLRRFQLGISQVLDAMGDAGKEVARFHEEATWPVSLLHGDLGVSNMLADQAGEIFLVDWERCEPGPVAWELRLFQRQAGLVHDVLHALSSPTDLSPTDQMQVALAVGLARYQGKRPPFRVQVWHQERLRQVRWIARTMDDQFTIPGTSVRFGWDAIIGLLPGIGDLVTSAFSLVIVHHAWRMGVSSIVLLRMIGNIGIDLAFGIVPIAGDALDLAWKANLKNAKLIKQHLQRANWP
jgi:hypothetical protein